MLFRGGGETRRWQFATAIVAALGVFVALIAGSSLRPQFAAATLPEPAAWSGTAPGAGAQVLPRGRDAAVARPAPAAAQSSTPANNADKKPFHSMWMTKERPQPWNRSSAQSALSPTPTTFSPARATLGDAQSRSPTTIPADRDTLTRLCIARV
ncbi:hypothetical protein [Mycobacterium marseillense]|uniref:hypothetical protein n=1 Tax=Mycobacterium marseillense TaxID=701042 RepID=UPI0007FF4D50|nr:hypothetical protein [Mycobacterium marseillense]MCA2266839.1 hypothetical protein [Mycobacterium marseillense]MCV7405789.1 hypothetical protein [Mycobacterium marseillense]OBJ69031.1 hypothetical protein A5626_06500 [Mycobacterium marseillense]ORA93430.1 hypothetical protein BST31_11655 [Mycobacterium marseillense]